MNIVDINGLTLDRDKTYTEATRVMFFEPGGRWICSIGNWILQEERAMGAVAVIWRAGKTPPLLKPTPLDREGFEVIQPSRGSRRRRGECWAPLLDFAMEAGLELPIAP